jgi:hypothetical protein
MVLMADKGRYMGGAFVTFKTDKRQALWDRVQRKVGAAPPKGLAKDKGRMVKARSGRPGQVLERRGKAAPRLVARFLGELVRCGFLYSKEPMLGSSTY